MDDGMNKRLAKDTADADLPEDFTSAWASVLLDLHEKARHRAVPVEPAETTNAGNEDCQPDR